jgi:hypothetical protein
MQEEDIQALRAAIAALEHPGFAARLAEIAGKPIELFNRTLPEPASKAIAVATTQALGTALRAALRTMQNEPKAASSYLHKAASGIGISPLVLSRTASTAFLFDYRPHYPQPPRLPSLIRHR